MTVTVAERATWLPSPCPRCGGPRGFDGEWLDITTLGDAEPLYAPRDVWCETPRCGQVCRICRREPGDVHGPHCWELMAAKAARPPIVDWSDCR